VIVAWTGSETGSVYQTANSSDKASEACRAIMRDVPSASARVLTWQEAKEAGLVE